MNTDEKAKLCTNETRAEESFVNVLARQSRRWNC